MYEDPNDTIGQCRQLGLTTMTPTALFDYCLKSRDHFLRVTSYLRIQPNKEIGSRTGAFRCVPIELIEMIVLLLGVTDNIRFGATCRVHKAVASRAFLALGANRIRPYNLSLIHLRFLQSCTNAMIAGTVLKRLLHTGEDLRWPSWRLHDPAPVSPLTLDFYCPRYKGGEVRRFLALATGYEYDREPLDTATDVFTLRETFTLTHQLRPSINIYEANSDNPLDAILHLPVTADICAWTLDRIWLGYPNPTFEGIAITSPNRLRTGTLEDEQKTWGVLHTNLQNGFWIDSRWSGQHTCLVSPNCPTSWRTNDDAGCLSIMFPNLPFTADCTEYIWNFGDTSWTLGAIALCYNAWSRKPVRKSFRQHECKQIHQEPSTLIDPLQMKYGKIVCMT
ncbi:hypothetical protein C8F04DRAFT_1190220 [Mycena alexandri]|uniref:F-box domain-containing protein n=1 Tax=Mycena alexandri TaxID=1745969 RepID=A0AAD6SIS3_9AGAR|nr:hypothetical protein C8F04DRAFT_1190220 [Mycena alexandri]